MLLRELFTNPKRILLEGGNIWPDTSSFDQAYAADLAQEASRYLQGVGAKAHLIGSAATPKPGRMSGDLDVMTDMTHLMNHFKIKDPKEARIQLEKFMQGQGLQTKRTGVTVHIRMPYIGKFYQVDIKAVYNAEKVHLFHVHDIPDNSPYKGVNKQMMMNALATSQNMLWSPDEGLYARDDAGKKAQLLTYELDDVAKYLIGPDATAKDLGSVESIMSAIPNEARRNEIFQLASSGSSWQKTTPINEAASPAVGRKYQHIEDLVFTNGSVGGLHAVERLRHMTTKGKGIELKWDGSPVVYWGRDEHGKFQMFPKNAWDYMKRGTTHTKSGITTIMNDPDDVMNFVMGTGSVQPGQEAKRQAFAQGLANLWPLFETISPKTGFIEGGILFYPDKPAKLNPTTGEYDFTPNITSFHIPSRSELGERIASAQVMVAATGYYTRIGSEEQRYPNAEQLSTKDVIVQGTTYVDRSPQIDNSGLDHVEDYIKKNKAAIDSFVAGQPGLSKPGDVLYSFFNQNLRVEGVKAKFVDWANHKLSSSQAQKVLSHPGLDIILTAVEMLTSQKMKVINALSTGTHSGIRQTKPEGYVQAHPGGKFKNDLPGQFVKTIDQATWAPRKDDEPA